MKINNEQPATSPNFFVIKFIKKNLVNKLNIPFIKIVSKLLLY